MTRPVDTHERVLARAVQVVVSTRSAAAAVLQQRMGIDAAMAERLLDELARAGVVSPARPGGGDRRVLVGVDQLDATLAAVVTVGEAPVSTGVSGKSSRASAVPVGVGEDSTLHPNLITVRERVRGVLVGARAYWTPPSVLTDPPPSVADLAAYAWRGGWTTSGSGAVRRAGIWWHRLVGVPVTAVCRYGEWLWQRPLRVLPVFVLWKLLISTGPGPWAAAHLFRPVLGLVARVLL